MIAAGKERIYNPEGLSWFQNIELTALNTYAISARDGAPRPELGVMVPPFAMGMPQQQIPGSHTLVEYRKEGEWVYYKDYLRPPVSKDATLSREGIFELGYMHFGTELYANIASYDHLELAVSYDSMHAAYADDRMVDLFGFSSREQDHLSFSYYPSFAGFHWQPGSRARKLDSPGPLRQVSRLDREGKLIGVREDYDRAGRAIRTERFLVPYKREEEEVGALH